MLISSAETKEAIKTNNNVKNLRNIINYPLKHNDHTQGRKKFRELCGFYKFYFHYTTITPKSIRTFFRPLRQFVSSYSFTLLKKNSSGSPLSKLCTIPLGSYRKLPIKIDMLKVELSGKMHPGGSHEKVPFYRNSDYSHS